MRHHDPSADSARRRVKDFPPWRRSWDCGPRWSVASRGGFSGGRASVTFTSRTVLPASTCMLDGVARLVGGGAVVQRLHVVDRDAIDRLHHLALFDPGIGQGAAGIDILDQHAAGRAPGPAPRPWRCPRVAGGADPGQVHAGACPPCRLPRPPPRAWPGWREWQNRCRCCRRCANRSRY